MPTLTTTTATLPSTVMKFRNGPSPTPSSGQSQSFVYVNENSATSPTVLWIDPSLSYYSRPTALSNLPVYHHPQPAQTGESNHHQGRLSISHRNHHQHHHHRHPYHYPNHHHHNVDSNQSINSSSASTASSKRKSIRLSRSSNGNHWSQVNMSQKSITEEEASGGGDKHSSNGVANGQSVDQVPDVPLPSLVDDSVVSSVNFDDVHSLTSIGNGNSSGINFSTDASMSTAETSVSNKSANANGTSTSKLSNSKLPQKTVMLAKHIYDWSVEDVANWLKLNHFESYIELFCDRHRIDGRVLIELSPNDLRTDLSITVFGDIKRLCMAFGAIRENYLKNPDVQEEEIVDESIKHHQNGHHNYRTKSKPVRKISSGKQPQLSLTRQQTMPPFNNKSHHYPNNNKQLRQRANKASANQQRVNHSIPKSQSFPQPNYRPPLKTEDSTEDDFDRIGVIFDEYDDDDAEDDVDEGEILEEHPEFTARANANAHLYGAPNNIGSYYQSAAASHDSVSGPNDSDTMSETSTSSLSSLSGSSNDSSTVSHTSMSKYNSDSAPSVDPTPTTTSEAIPLNFYVQQTGLNTNRHIQAQIIPTVTTGAQLASMAAYYNAGGSRQPPFQQHHNQAPVLYQQLPPPATYPSQFHQPQGTNNNNNTNGNGNGNNATAKDTHKKKSHNRGRGHTVHHHSHHRHGHHGHSHREFKPEAWKAIVAMMYFFGSTWVTAIVMVIVHDRVPDMDTYPPLPDILLDNMPLIPWAFGMCEFCGLVLFIIWAFILIFHKHRFILMRRMFSLFGSVFLLRCVTMLITSLSVPGRHLECKARPYGSWMERIHQAYLIWQGGGMSIQGVRTCGDYMFSGHTVVLTLLNFFITEYTPTKLYLVHTLSWVVNLFGIFFILAAHEHYSIDVFIAFYISTRLFLYYHTLANNRALYQRDRHRTRIWFPLFYFFESGINGIVPNQYEVPFRKLKHRISLYLAERLSAGFVFTSLSGNGSSADLLKQDDINNKTLTNQQTSSTTSSASSNASSVGGQNGKVVNGSVVLDGVNNKIKTQ